MTNYPFRPVNASTVPDWFNLYTQGGAVQSSAASPKDTTAALQAGFNQAVALNVPAYLPSGYYVASALTIPAGLVLIGDAAGSYPSNASIPAVTVLARLAGSNQDFFTAPDGNNYFRIQDIAVDGNKANNTSGYGLRIVDGAAGQECQATIERCYIHDNPQSNLYLGHNRRAVKVLHGVFTASGSGDGITVAGSDNFIWGNIIGSNGRGGLVLGTAQTQNWAASNPNNAAAVTHAFGNDIFGNQVGVAIAQFSSNCMVLNNGIDRNSFQGVTVFDGASNVVHGNALHSNGTQTNNTYAHIDVSSSITKVCIDSNVFGPLDGGIVNVASFGVNVAATAPAGCITGDIGVADSTATVGGLINAGPWAGVTAYGPVDVVTAGQGLKVAEGSNAKQGTATLAAGTVVVANTSVTAASRIILTAQDNNSTGALRVSARTAGTSFTITSSNAADTGVVAYEIFEPG